ncbi:MAG: K(+)-transporting ATPase subunit C [Phormidesmis sp.]
MVKEIVTGIRSTAVLWLLTAIVYPAFMLLVGQGIFPYQANGSLITNAQNQVVGSALMGQSFTAANYFRSRPSVASYSEGADAQPTGISGASNLAPSNPELIDRVDSTAADLQQANIPLTADLLYASGSGLDPHISPAAAAAQANAVAIARNLTAEQVSQLIADNTQGRFLGLFGEPGVNVTMLNIALDNLAAGN